MADSITISRRIYTLLVTYITLCIHHIIEEEGKGKYLGYAVSLEEIKLTEKVQNT